MRATPGSLNQSIAANPCKKAEIKVAAQSMKYSNVPKMHLKLKKLKQLNISCMHIHITEP